jgi:hypothetical protein
MKPVKRTENMPEGGQTQNIYLLPKEHYLSKYDSLGVQHYSKSSVITRLAYDLIDFIKTNDNALTIKDFQASRNLTDADIKKFEKKNTSFARALAIAREVQTAKLIQLGVKRTGNGNFIAVILRNLNNWRLQDKALEHDQKTTVNIKLHLPDKYGAVQGAKYEVIEPKRLKAPEKIKIDTSVIAGERCEENHSKN